MTNKKHIYGTILIFIFVLMSTNLNAQIDSTKINWQNLDNKINGVMGTSVEKAYQLLLKDKIEYPIVVAVIDGGVDIDHEDLKQNIWTNTKEIPGNGKDDDHNGYIDDIHGWNFMGSSKGDFQIDNAELVRTLRFEMKRNRHSQKVLELKIELNKKLELLRPALDRLEEQQTGIKNIIKEIGVENPTLEELQNYKYTSELEYQALIYLVKAMRARKQNFKEFLPDFEHEYQKYKNQVYGVWNINYDPREDNKKEYKRRFHGNGNVKGIDPRHGTQVSGVIAANRNNGKGIKGLSHSKIMVLRAIPEGDFFDEDLISSIHYAVDNGAKIINLSFGKLNSSRIKEIDKAVKYAMENDVLIIHSSGNEGKMEINESNIPSRNYVNGGSADAWLEVGASDCKDDENLLARFSNYGKNTTDVLAPGVNIITTFPSNEYKSASGTSIAAPVVSGLAALIRSYYPKLTAIKVKYVILNSVRKINHKVINKDGQELSFSDVCLSGGIVNAFEALQMANKL